MTRLFLLTALIAYASAHGVDTTTTKATTTTTSTTATTTTSTQATTTTERPQCEEPEHPPPCCDNMADFCDSRLTKIRCFDPYYAPLLRKACPQTCGTCERGNDYWLGHLAAEWPSREKCRDRISPKGFADCSTLSHLCNHKMYFDFMTTYCPKTCGRCHHLYPGHHHEDSMHHGHHDMHHEPGLHRHHDDHGTQEQLDHHLHFGHDNDNDESIQTFHFGHHNAHERPSSGSCDDHDHDDEDKFSCFENEDLCGHPSYHRLMTMRCPKTCRTYFRRIERKLYSSLRIPKTTKNDWELPPKHGCRKKNRPTRLIINL